MPKKEVTLTEDEKEQLRSLSASDKRAVANRNRCSKAYVHAIISGDSGVRSDLAKSVLRDLRRKLRTQRTTPEDNG